MQYLVAFAGVLLLSTVLGWVAAGRALAPLKRINETARRVSEQHLDERIDVDGPHDELRELGETLNSMLDRLADSFETQRRFVANASHELRSPLTVIRSEAEVALANPEPDLDELRGMAESVVQASRRTEALLASLLILARSQRALPRTTTVELDAAAGVALDEARGLAAEQGVRLTRGARARRRRRRRRAAGAGGREPDRERRPLQPPGRLRGGRHAGGRLAPPSCASRTAARAWSPRTPPGWLSRSSAWPARPAAAAPGWGCRS